MHVDYDSTLECNFRVSFDVTRAFIGFLFPPVSITPKSRGSMKIVEIMGRFVALFQQ